ncbi:MAG: hypothetical protein HQK65_00630 [Desulfamplus sp.]|nr:hypothetical protein [Desulfamplus sp.]
MAQSQRTPSAEDSQKRVIVSKKLKWMISQEAKKHAMTILDFVDSLTSYCASEEQEPHQTMKVEFSQELQSLLFEEANKIGVSVEEFTKRLCNSIQHRKDQQREYERSRKSIRVTVDSQTYREIFEEAQKLDDMEPPELLRKCFQHFKENKPILTKQQELILSETIQNIRVSTNALVVIAEYCNVYQPKETKRFFRKNQEFDFYEVRKRLFVLEDRLNYMLQEIGNAH